jgi:hypothetical protein
LNIPINKKVYTYYDYTEDLTYYFNSNLNTAKQKKNQKKIALCSLFEYFMFKLGPGIAFGLAMSAFRVSQVYAAPFTPTTL